MYGIYNLCVVTWGQHHRTTYNVCSRLWFGHEVLVIHEICVIVHNRPCYIHARSWPFTYYNSLVATQARKVLKTKTRRVWMHQSKRVNKKRLMVLINMFSYLNFDEIQQHNRCEWVSSTWGTHYTGLHWYTPWPVTECCLPYQHHKISILFRHVPTIYTSNA